MANKICVYTCITGDYDTIKEVEKPEENIDYYCFTNNQKLKSKTWKIVQIKDDELDNRLLARKTKILGHSIINSYDIAVWSDADVVWRTPISRFIETYFRKTSFAIFKHHARNNIHDEAIACLSVRKDTKENLLKLFDFYKNAQYPDNNGLCESTVFIKKPKDEQVIKTAKVWYDMVKNYSPRDQLSFNYAIWKTDLKVTYIDLNVWGNPWFSTTPHNPEPKIDSCHIYYGDPSQKININNYYIYDYSKKENTYYFETIIPNSTAEIELNPSNIIGIKYEDFTISPQPDHLTTDGIIAFVSCSPRGVFHIYGNFQKGKKLSFSFKVGTPTSTEIKTILKSQWEQNSKIIQNLQVENIKLVSINKKLREDLEKIIHSKGWRALEKLRKITPHPHK